MILMAMSQTSLYYKSVLDYCWYNKSRCRSISTVPGYSSSNSVQSYSPPSVVFDILLFLDTTGASPLGSFDALLVCLWPLTTTHTHHTTSSLPRSLQVSNSRFPKQVDFH